MKGKFILLLIVAGFLLVHAAPIVINFAAWTYDMTKVRDNLARFQAWIKETEGLDVEVRLVDFPFGTFDVNITINFLGGSYFDVFYTSDHWLAKWRAAGWIVPLEQYMSLPEKDDLIPYVRNALTLDEQLFALPYYADIMCFVYNKRMLADAGLPTPPATWDEVVAYGRRLKELGIVEYPFWVSLKSTAWFEEVVFALIYGFGGDLFDDKTFSIVFDTESGPVYEAIAWLKRAFDEGIISPRALEMTAVDVQEVVKAGAAAFAIVPSYMLAEFNLAPGSKVRGEIDIALMPGTGMTTGFARGYVLSPAGVKDPVKRLACERLIRFLGGKVTIAGVEAYHIAKRWTIENGLGFGYSSMWDDPDVVEFLSQVGTVEVMKRQKAQALLKDGLKAPWYIEWIRELRSEVQAVLLGRQNVISALTNLRNAWIKLAGG